MSRVLDLVALRSLVAIVDMGGVTRAANLLNLTQSAISMQIKRLEVMLDLPLFSRTGRSLTLTNEGEQLLSFARRMLALNDEAMARLTSVGQQGEIRLGVPHDIVYPAIPPILKRLSLRFPRIRVNLVSSFTLLLKDDFAKGLHDVVLTTEDIPDEGGEVLATHDLVWVSAPSGQIAAARPLRLAFKENCIFRPKVIAALDAAGILWEMAVDTASESVVEATVAADLAVSARLRSLMPAGICPVGPQAGLPKLGVQHICLYTAPTLQGEVADALTAELRAAYRA